MEKTNNTPFDRLFAFMLKPLVIIPYFALVILLILYWDKPLSTWFFHADLRSYLPFLSYVTRIGLGALYFLLLPLLILLFRYVWKQPEWEIKAWFLLLCLSLSTAICLVVKMLLGRARPNMFLQGDRHFYGFYGFQTDANFWSFPSGHTTTIMSIVLGLSILFPRYFKGLLTLGVLVALTRVLLTHHYLSDVLFTVYLTTLEIGCLLYVLRSKSWLVQAIQDPSKVQN